MALAKSFFVYALLPAFLKSSAFSTTTTKNNALILSHHAQLNRPTKKLRRIHVTRFTRPSDEW